MVHVHIWLKWCPFYSFNCVICTLFLFLLRVLSLLQWHHYGCHGNPEPQNWKIKWPCSVGGWENKWKARHGQTVSLTLQYDELCKEKKNRLIVEHVYINKPLRLSVKHLNLVQGWLRVFFLNKLNEVYCV